MKKRNIVLFSLLAMGLGISDFALAGVCTRNGAPMSYTFDYTRTLTNNSENRTGILISPAYTWSLPDGYQMICSCSGRFRDVYYTAKTDLRPGHYDGRQFYTVNDYLEAAVSIYVKGYRNSYYDVPFTDLNNIYSHDPSGTNLSCNTATPDFYTGSQGSVTLYFKRAFVGVVELGTTRLVTLYGSTTTPVPTGSAVSYVTMKGTVTVPQSCSITEGQSITIDFGDMNANDFAAKGSKPDGVAIVNKKLNLNCTQIDQGVELNMRFVAEVDPASTNAIKTSNSNIGIIIEDENRNIITPNTGEIPITYDYNASTGSVVINTYPISSTGIKPTAGVFTGMATIRVEFR
ncbi:fimbrial protein [Edaphovirga cremea]|uniref:fimbrial protein n=1 Tax=Edaphovirga cremea TaxID=2267246 RepID=UPI0013005C25|nr:fimbrial protein [Edaphovirga cremea]